MTATFDANMRTVEDIFDPRVSYWNPPLQRPYVWECTQWRDLWSDVVDATADAVDASHFLGAIVLQRRPKEGRHVDSPLVVDGQQRLTTLQLLLAAIRDTAAEKSETDGDEMGRVASRVGELLLNSTAASGSLDDRCKIRHSYGRDRRAFQSIVSNCSVVDHGGSSQSVVKCYQFYQEQVNQHCGTDPVTNLKALERSVTDVIRLAVVEIGQETDLYSVFGRLNANGTPLSHADYIKNEVTRDLDRLPDHQRDSIESLWIFDDDWWREDTSSVPSDGRRVESCIRHWLSDTLGAVVNIKKVHDVCTDHLRSVGVRRFLSELSEYAECYRQVESGLYPGVDDFLDHVTHLRQWAIMPLLVRLCKSVSDEGDLKEAVGVLDSYLMRRALCGAHSAGLNKYAVELAVKIRRAEGDRGIRPRLIADPEPFPFTALLRREFEGRYADESRYWPSDERLVREGKLAKVSESSRQMLFLRELEGFIGDPIPSGVSYTVEHVIPRSWRKHWFRDSKSPHDEDINAAMHSIGNMTLLPEKSNNRARDLPWHSKRPLLYSNRNLALNRELLEHANDHWGLEEVYARSERLLRLAACRWRGPSDGSLYR